VRFPLATVLALAVAAAIATQAEATTIRTGGPSAAGDPKVAVVASNHDLKGRRFVVTRGGGRVGEVVLRGRLRPAEGSSAPWRHAYLADLSSVRARGRYRVHVGPVFSRTWRVRGEGSAGLVDLVLDFFRSNSDGNEPSPIHAPSHLHDAVIKGGPHDGQHVDLTGGWMDAGDMIKFAQNEAFSAAALEAAARLDPADADAIGAQADVAIRWLEKLHPYPGVFVVQVGDHRDHDNGFRNPATDDSSSRPGIGQRVAYHWGSRVGGDIGGKVATALALAADRASGSRRAQLTAEAEQWYAAGRAAHRPTPRVIDPFYVDSNWKDSMAAGAAALYRVTGDLSYLHDARRYLREYGNGDAWGYYEMSPFAAADMCGALGAPPLGSSGAAQRQGCRALRASVRQIRRESRATAFGASGFISWGTTETDAAGGAEAALAARYAGFRGGMRIAAAGRDYLLGRNPWGASFIAGFGPHSPRKIHSWASVVGDGLPHGAVVGGPAAKRTILGQDVGRPGGPLAAFNARYAYEDRREDYVTSEPTIDSAASTVLLFAALRATN
jgi:endoglucanase